MQITATTSASAVDPVGAATSGSTGAGNGTLTGTGTGTGTGTTTSQAPVRLLNPQPTIDPALGIVVTEYFDKSGQLIEQYPTAKALSDYRVYGLPSAEKSASPTGNAAS